MAGITVTSKDGSKAWELEFEGEMHFGPFYFAAKPRGFALKEKIGSITDDIVWSRNGRYTAVVEVHFNPNATTLLRVNLTNGNVSRVDSASGLIVPISVLDDGKVKYEWREKSTKEIRQRN